MMRKKLPEGNSTGIAIKFLLLIFIIVLSSLVFKLGVLINKGSFDDTRRFTVSVHNDKAQELISFSPKSQTISILKINGRVKASDLNRFLGIPIDADIKTDLDIQEKLPDLMGKLILKFNNLKTNLTIVDIFRLYLFSRTIPQNYIYEKEISSNLDNLNTDKLISHFFTDEIIEKENVSIKIINSTGINGLGNRLARLISNMGGNVVIVATEERLENQSSISYFGKKTYTAERLAKILGFQLIKADKKAITDIIITIGKDNSSHSNF